MKEHTDVRTVRGRMMTAWGIALASLICVVTTGHGSDTRTELDSLLTRSVGGETAARRIRELTSLRSTGYLYRGADTIGRFESITKFPDKYRFALGSEQFAIAEGYDGTRAWSLGLSGVPSTLTGTEREQLLADFHFASFALVRNGAGMPLPFLSHVCCQIIDNISAHEISAVLPGSSDTATQLIAVDTGEPHTFTSKHADFYSHRVIDVLAPVDSILFPVQYHGYARNPDNVYYFSVDTVSLDEPFDDAIFDRPARQHALYAFAPGKDSVTLPISYRNGHLSLTVRINGGKRVRFLLDTGAPITGIDTGIVRKLQLPIVARVPQPMLGGMNTMEIAAISDIDMGGVHLHHSRAAKIDFTSFNANTRTHYSGVLGHEFFSGMLVRIDIAKKKLTLYDPLRSVPRPAEQHAYDFRLAEQKPVIDARVNGVPGQFLFDLGNASKLLVDGSFAERHDLVRALVPSDAPTLPIVGIGRSMNGRMGRADSVSLRTHVESLVPLILTEPDGPLAGPGIGGAFGTPFFSRFIIYLDYPNNRLYLVPREDR